MNGQPLHINVHVFDLKNDEKEETKQLTLRKVSATSKEEEARQLEALEKKYKWVINLIVWAVTNGKALEFVNAVGDEQ